MLKLLSYLTDKYLAVIYDDGEWKLTATDKGKEEPGRITYLFDLDLPVESYKPVAPKFKCQSNRTAVNEPICSSGGASSSSYSVTGMLTALISFYSLFEFLN